MKLIIACIYIVSIAYVHLRGRVRHKLGRQLSDHSSFLAPLNCFLYLFSKSPSKPYLNPADFPDLSPLQTHWEEIRAEGQNLMKAGDIKRSNQYDDVGFNSFFKTGWKRFYLKWYGDSHPSAMKLCPRTTELVQNIGSIKAAMFAELPPGSKLVRHRDPYAGSYRYHLGLETPNDASCYIDVDGEKYHWRDGEAVMFDETFIHYAENTTQQNRIILFCDVERPMKYRWVAAFNGWFSRNVMSAAGAPNEEGDRTGSINRLFAKVYTFRLRAKALKKRNRKLYYVQKWAFFGGILAAFVLI